VCFEPGVQTYHSTCMLLGFFLCCIDRVSFMYGYGIGGRLSVHVSTRFIFDGIVCWGMGCNGVHTVAF